MNREKSQLREKVLTKILPTLSRRFLGWQNLIKSDWRHPQTFNCRCAWRIAQTAQTAPTPQTAPDGCLSGVASAGARACQRPGLHANPCARCRQSIYAIASGVGRSQFASLCAQDSHGTHAMMGSPGNWNYDCRRKSSVGQGYYRSSRQQPEDESAPIKAGKYHNELEVSPLLLNTTCRGFLIIVAESTVYGSCLFDCRFVCLWVTTTEHDCTFSYLTWPCMQYYRNSEICDLTWFFSFLRILQRSAHQHHHPGQKVNSMLTPPYMPFLFTLAAFIVFSRLSHRT
jgi:hypothetical protein